MTDRESRGDQVILDAKRARRELNNRVRHLVAAAKEHGQQQEWAVRALQGLTEEVEEALRRHR